MGQTLSSHEVEAIKHEVYGYYPGLEQQLEMAFACHDMESEGALPYNVLEPVVRHLLMQYGLTEYITRFCKQIESQGANGEHIIKGSELDCNLIYNELNGFRVNIYRDMDVEAFKSFTLIWLKKVLDTYSDDQAEWAAKLIEEQERQSAEFTKAMSDFQDLYKHQQAVYCQGIEEQKKQVTEWNNILASAEKTQQDIYDKEVASISEQQALQKKMEKEKSGEQERFIQAYKEQLKDLGKSTSVKSGEGRGGIVCYDDGSYVTQTSFVYPTSATPYGACASAGSQEPTRRAFKGSKRGAKIMRKGCC